MPGKYYFQFPEMANGCWVPSASGNVPPNAFVGGEDGGEPLFVARGYFGNGQVPGKLLASHGCCYVPWEALKIH
ncbi:hypothetical protein MML48_1g07012 [Holotrichia oblita]|uniref:Uncharacterized protein n=1 Tax=Holotrichia oblita TaxID=644536 RepID=A0ACB9TVL8_HOLOL|nr:hypothetical protein MML48_1g07012 [Holotrichia oblita]